MEEYAFDIVFGDDGVVVIPQAIADKLLLWLKIEKKKRSYDGIATREVLKICLKNLRYYNLIYNFKLGGLRVL